VLGGSLEAYLASLPAKSRQDMRRSLRRFEGNFSGRYAFSTHCSVAEVSAFLARVESVSKRTYQARLGLGVVADSHIGNKVLEGAKRGYARCYLLTVDGQVIAWRIGFLYGNVYCSHHVGYDPKYEKWHPGAVVHLHSVCDLSESCVGVDTLDMLYGDNDFKRRATNRFRLERNYYLFPRSLRGATTYVALRSCNGVSEWLGRLLERLGLKRRLKAWLRRG
jgi:CelD/BcsL family acetyltransferase involved in cellulose biosynthesis